MMHTTKVVVLLSTLIAAFAELYLATTPLFPAVFWIATIGFAVTALLGSRLQRIVSPLVLLPVYLMPAAYVRWLGYESFALEIIWVLPLLGDRKSVV